MNEQELSLRLKRVGSYVSDQARLADIGSDHAYLPVALALQGKISFAIAGEVVKGPYESAAKQVRKSGLTEKIEVRLADGLDAIEDTDQIDHIVIAGMGGTLIRSILQNGVEQQRITGHERLILQPNVGEKNLREWLMENHYHITHEEIIEENQKIYEIIVAEKGPTDYQPQELFFGPILLTERNEVFRQKWQRELNQKRHVLQQLRQAETLPAEKMAELIEQIKWIEEVLA